MATADVNGIIRRNLSTRYPPGDRNRGTTSRQRFFQFQVNMPQMPANDHVYPAFQQNRQGGSAREIQRQQTSRQRFFLLPSAPAVPPSPQGATTLGGPAFEANRRYAIMWHRELRSRLHVFAPGWQQPALPGNQVTVPALNLMRRFGLVFARRLALRPKAFHQALAAPVPPFSPGNAVSGPAFEANRRYSAAYHRVLRDRTRVFLSGGGIEEGASPLFSGAGRLTCTPTMQIQAAVAFAGTGSLDVFPVTNPKYTALSYIPADTTLVLAGFTLAEQAECQLGTDGNVPAGTTNFGFVDTTYTLSKAQILATCSTSVL